VSLDDTAKVTSWDPNLNQGAFTVRIADGLAYIGGNYTQVNGSVGRERAAAFRTDDTGTVTGWNPNVSGPVWDIQLTSDTAYLAGEFSAVKGLARNKFAAVSLDDTAAATPWNPNALCTSCMMSSASGYSIQLAGDVAYLGGTFDTVAGTAGVLGLAAVRNDDTGSLITSWAPTVASASPFSLPTIRRLSLESGVISVAGSFIGVTLAGTLHAGNLAVIPAIASAPSAPTAVNATPGNASASIAWNPGSDGGSPVTRIDFALDDTSTVDASTATTSSPHTITGLTNGRSYTVFVRAVNAVGVGAWSVASAAFTPQAPPGPPPSLAPGAPTDALAQPGNASASITWTPPIDPGSFPIDGYVVRALPGGQTCSTSSTSCTVDGLSNGTAYIFTVTASNAAGTGPASAASVPVTPRTVPGAPTSLAATPGNERATVSWSASIDDGGSPITGYRVTTAPGSRGCTVTVTACILTGLINDRSYAVTVVATNAAGASLASFPVAVTPRRAASILITGSRDRDDRRIVKIRGTVTGLDVDTIQPYIRLGNRRAFSKSITTAEVSSQGSFRWRRVTSRSITIYVTAGGTESNRITFRGL
jgi:hypothetical protein